MQGMAAAAQAYGAGKAIASDGILVKNEVGAGFASSSNTSNVDGSTAVGSTINGGNNVTLTSTTGDIHATGANLGAGKTLSLDSARDIVLHASQSSAHADGKNHSAGAEVGVGFQAGAQGTGVYAYANVGNGHNKSDSATYNNTQLKAETINITREGDTTLRGATATANTINADVGGKLAIESLQEISKKETAGPTLAAVCRYRSAPYRKFPVACLKRIPNPANSDPWISTSPSGVPIMGDYKKRAGTDATAYPVYESKK